MTGARQVLRRVAVWLLLVADAPPAHPLGLTDRMNLAWTEVFMIAEANDWTISMAQVDAVAASWATNSLEAESMGDTLTHLINSLGG
jgi:hypothetical protein